MSDCYHCGLPVPPGAEFPVVIDGAARPMCCPGCQAVAGAIVAGGFDRFYQYRSTTSAQAAEQQGQTLEHYDLAEIQADFVHRQENGSVAAVLYVSGITCSACAWLIEHYLTRVAGVQGVTVNVSTHRCRLVWNPDQVKLSAILHAFADIGYQARPAGDEQAEKQRSRDNRTFLLRLGLAGLSSMQAGHAAIALYAGAWSGIDHEWVVALRWVSLLLTIPVVFYSSIPFYSAAWRSLKMGHLVMDVPVSLAIILAFVASVWATVTNTGEVYYDSVGMFAFLLLLARYLEMRVRHRNEHQTASLVQLIPPVALRIDADGEQLVPVKSLKPGDLVLVRGGQNLPCDGEVVKGASEVVEAILTGEQNPVAKVPGDAVSAGTVNLENPLEVRVGAVGASTRIAAILNLVDAAEAVKPRRAALADRIAGWFVGAVLVISVLVAVAWYFIDPSRAFWISLSVLVVTCPCALSLATPAALTVAAGELRKRGFLIRKAHVLETLAVVDRAIFDKTGTLTQGRMRLGGVVPVPGVATDDLVHLAAALERGVTHPIAHAFADLTGSIPQATGLRVHVGEGVSAAIKGETHVFGKPELLVRLLAVDPCAIPAGDGQWLALANGSGLLGWLELVDELRPGADQAIAGLRALGVGVELLSGDRPAVAARVAGELDIGEWRGSASPEDKLARVHQLHAQGAKVLMVGDGINDVPVLSGADVSVAMGDAVDLTRLHADSLLVSGSLTALVDAIRIARKTEVIIRQNLAWSLGYNLIAVPAAALGFVPPWLAAVGMSSSSLIVVINALRLARLPRPSTAR